MAGAIVVNHMLLDTAERLAVEYEQYAAGSVLRCYARAVRRLRRRGVDPADLASASETLARMMLDRRPATVSSGYLTRSGTARAGTATAARHFGTDYFSAARVQQAQ